MLLYETDFRQEVLGSVTNNNMLGNFNSFSQPAKPLENKTYFRSVSENSSSDLSMMRIEDFLFIGYVMSVLQFLY